MSNIQFLSRSHHDRFWIIVIHTRPKQEADNAVCDNRIDLVASVVLFYRIELKEEGRKRQKKKKKKKRGGGGSRERERERGQSVLFTVICSVAIGVKQSGRVQQINGWSPQHRSGDFTVGHSLTL